MPSGLKMCSLYLTIILYCENFYVNIYNTVYHHHNLYPRRRKRAARVRAIIPQSNENTDGASSSKGDKWMGTRGQWVDKGQKNLLSQREQNWLSGSINQYLPWAVAWRPKLVPSCYLMMSECFVSRCQNERERVEKVHRRLT